MTFSIIARDPLTGEIGAATQSFLTGVGSRVLFGEAGCGVVVSQMVYHPPHARLALDVLRAGGSAKDALDAAIANDALAAVRQVAVMGRTGPPAAFTGTAVVGSAEQAITADTVAIGAMLTNPGIPASMTEAFAGARGPLAWRLLAALEQSERLGGDLRGSRAAALAVFDANEVTGRRIDLRVDHSETPLVGLRTALLGYDLNAAIERAFDELVAGRLDAAEHLLAALEPVAAGDPDRAFRHALVLALQGNLVAAKAQLERTTASPGNWREVVTRVAKSGLVPLDDQMVRALNADGPAPAATSSNN
jgi:uncharacterized Ntn-hydrolase superfamily protein